LKKSIGTGDTRDSISACHRPTQISKKSKEYSLMDMGKIMIGIALVMLSVGLLISPSGATGCNLSCLVGSGSAFSPADVPVTPYSPQVRDTPAGNLADAGNASHGSKKP
jgi:hypothetical protein